VVDLIKYVIIGLLVLLFIVLLFKTSYVKVPVDKAAVITGVGKQKTLIGKCGWKIPFLDSVCYVSLENIPLQINVGALALGDINVLLNGTAVVKIDSTPEAVVAATERYCNEGTTKTVQKIREVTEPIIEGALRGSSATLSPEDINENRDKFECTVKGNIIDDLRQMGLKLDSYTLNDIQTPDGYFKNKTEPKMAESRSLADIATAERQRDAEIKTADAEREANKARYASDAEIAAAARDKKVKMERYRAEENQATVEADAAKKLTEIEKNKEIERRNAELETIKAEAVEQRLVAEVEKPANAEKKKKEIEAQATANSALIEAKAKAEAMKIAAEAEAEAIRLKGEAEAEAIKAKSVAEAEGLEAKAKAYEKYNDVGKLDIIAPIIAEIGKASAESLKAIDKVTIVDGGDGDGVSGFGGNCMKNIAASMETIEHLTGVDPKELIQKDYKKQLDLRLTADNMAKEEIKEALDANVTSEEVVEESSEAVEETKPGEKPKRIRKSKKTETE